MTYNDENRMSVHQDGATYVTYTYAGDGLKRSEEDAGGVTTLIWDGSEYLGELHIADPSMDAISCVPKRGS